MDLPSWLYNSESFENCIFPERIKEFPSTNSEEDTIDTLEICSTWKVYSFPVLLCLSWSLLKKNSRSWLVWI